MTDSERLIVISEYAGMSLNKLAKEIGITTSQTFYDIKAGKHGISKDLAEKIQARYLNISMAWLLTGEGEMLITDTAPRIEETSIVRADEEVDVDIEGLMLDTNIAPTDIAQIIGEDIEYLRRCNNKLYPRHILKLQDRFGDALVDKYAKYSNVVEAEIIESFPIVPEAVIAEPNTNIEEVIEEDGSELEAINPSLLLSKLKVNAAEQIKGTSMLPTFQPNDWVFIRFLTDKMKIISGKTYYLNCKNRPTMIRMVKFEGEDKLRLIAKNSQYDDIVICRSDIINIGNVAAIFRMTFGDQYSEMENLRRTKEDQLNRFIDMQSEMVAEIREQGKRNDKERERVDRLIEKIIGDK